MKQKYDGRSELEKANKNLRQSELKYRSLYEGSVDLYRTVNVDGVIIDCNRSYAESLGYPKREILGKSIFNHVHKSEMAAMRDSFETWKKTGRVLNREVRLMRKDGTTFPTLISANNLYDERGNLVGTNTVIKDISELRQTESKFRGLYENSPDLYRTINKEGIILNCNKSYAEHLGYTIEEIIGKSIFEHVSKEGKSEMHDLFETWKKTGRVLNREVRLMRKDGTTFPTLISATNLYDNDGTLIGSNTVIKDITEIYEAEEKIKQDKKQIQNQLEELQKLSKTKDEFLTMITHELKTPLVPIKSYIDMILSEKFGPLNEVQKQKLQVINESTGSMLKLVYDLLDVQKLELRQFILNKKMHSLSEIINNTIQMAKPSASHNDIRITTDMKNNVSCLCDKSSIERVIMNIISNCIDFCPKHAGKIQIKLFSENNHAKIIVKDNGIGIVKENLEKVFQKFYQVDSSFTREHTGTGLGLSVCKGIIEKHGGKMWAESDGHGEGTEIHFLLPLQFIRVFEHKLNYN